MQQDLSELTRELQKETCPPRVINKVRGRISARLWSAGQLRIAVAFAVVVVACGFVAWRWQAGVNARQQVEAERTTLARTRVANQAEGALTLVGSELLDASAHSGKIISDRAVPPLRNSIEIAKNKIINPMEL